MLNIKPSNAVAEEPNTVMLIGPAKVGKTVCAVTFSAQCPDELPSKTRADLNDLIVLQLEAGGSRSLMPLGINVPNVIDLSDITITESTGVRGLEQQLDEALNYYTEKRKEQPELKLVVDSISALDDLVASFFRGKYPGGKEAWDNIIGFHSRLRNKLRGLHCGLVLVCHTKAPIQLDDKAGKAEAYREAKAAAEAIEGEAAMVQIDITGASAKHYSRLVDHILPVTSKSVRDKHGTRRVYSIHPRGTSHIPGASRYSQLLDDAEPAHLNRMFKKIAAKMEAFK
jgi:hypothetical protein